MGTDWPRTIKPFHLGGLMGTSAVGGAAAMKRGARLPHLRGPQKLRGPSQETQVTKAVAESCRTAAALSTPEPQQSRGDQPTPGAKATRGAGERLGSSSPGRQRPSAPSAPAGSPLRTLGSPAGSGAREVGRDRTETTGGGRATGRRNSPGRGAVWRGPVGSPGHRGDAGRRGGGGGGGGTPSLFPQG